MDDDDYRALIALLERELRDVGASEIADERHYVQVDPESGEAHLLNPRERLIEMLRAFDRRLVVEDRATYDLALQRMNDRLRGQGPRGAVVVPTTDDREARLVELEAAPAISRV